MLPASKLFIPRSLGIRIHSLQLPAGVASTASGTPEAMRAQEKGLQAVFASVEVSREK